MFYRRREALRALVLAPAVAALSGCGAVISALPVVARIVMDAMAVLTGINNAVQEIFRTRPDIPLNVRRTYTRYFDGAITALRALQAAAEEGQDLSNGQVAAAFDAFEAAYKILRDYLGHQGWMTTDGRLMIDGQVLAEAPPPSAFRR